MSEFRIGSRVACVAVGNEQEHIGPLGTVIDREFDDDDRVSRLTVRWDDGEVRSHFQLLTLPNGLTFELLDVTPKVYVNIYLHKRAFGGREEGGWRYDTYTPSNDLDAKVETRHFMSTDAAYDAYQAAMAKCVEENKTRRSPSSVISQGHYVAMLEAWPATPQPEFRPYYK